MSARIHQDDRRRLRDLIVVGWSHAGQHAYVASLGIAIPYVIVSFHTNYAMVGILLSIAAIAGSALQVLALVVRKTSARLLFTIQNIGSTIGAVAAALAPGIYIFMAGRLIQSGAGWPQHPVGGSYLANRYPKTRGTTLSWHVTAGNIGTLLAPLLMPSIIATYGWRAAFWTLSALLVTTTVAVAVWLPSPWRGLTSTNDSADQEGIGFWSRLRALIRQRPVFALLVAGSVAAGGQGIGIVGVYTPGYLHTSLHLSAISLTVILTLLYAGAVVGPILMGSLADRRSHRGVLITNYGLGALALLLFVFSGKDILSLSLFGIAIGIFSYSELSLRQTVFSDYLPPGMSRAGFGVFFTASQSIGALWIAIIGITVADGGFRDAFILMAITFLAAALIVLWGTHKRPATRDNS
ncbi:MFS transporter [Ferrimicrobium acidiphilum]|uniref:Major facilitator superfamily protein n=1 Tax=Ferrimicrobium acidiphilum DSM 19497 TaxID=1121877 RepID=A0A0D8FYG2_9ACTN|nr:MFS transporter [Ferrimicrobium acidiphilum]KJE78206.1 major facilitator superfamily protein [Ferrimicrobium acidiphilum DSM 19497]